MFRCVQLGREENSNAWLRASVHPGGPTPRACADQEKRSGARNCSQAGPAPVLSAGQCMGPPTLFAGQRMGACAVTLRRGMHAAQGNLWELMRPLVWPWERVGRGVAHGSACGHLFGAGQRLDVCFIWYWICVHPNVVCVYLDVASVIIAIHVCCNSYTRMLQAYISNVSSVLNYVASVLFICCICFSGYIHMLQASIQNVSYVSNVYCKCFILMLHLLYTYVASVCCKCFTCLRRMSQKCFVLHVSGSRKRAHAEAVPTSVVVPMWVASKADVGGPHLYAHQLAWGGHQ
jgi:hypothetical protein